MPSLVVIGQQIKEKRRGGALCPVYMVPKYPSLNRVKYDEPRRNEDTKPDEGTYIENNDAKLSFACLVFIWVCRLILFRLTSRATL